MYWRIKNSLSIMKNNMTKKHFENITNNEGMGVVEVILIIVVLIGLVIIFKTQITSLVNNILSKITSQANSI